MAHSLTAFQGKLQLFLPREFEHLSFEQTLKEFQAAFCCGSLQSRSGSATTKRDAIYVSVAQTTGPCKNSYAAFHYFQGYGAFEETCEESCGS